MAALTRLSSAASDLRLSMRGAVVLPGDVEYAGARRIWNGAVDRRPALVARCACTSDVGAAIEVARAYGLALSVRSGGHDWAGRALCDDGLVIDLSEINHVEVDAKSRVAVVGGGATSAAVVAAAGGAGLVAVTGTVGAVGMAGLTLGGGYGPLSGCFGLAADNLLGAEVVLGDGRVVLAGPDVLWGLRGGGGNFGVVTSMRIRLHEIPALLGGVVVFPWDEAERVLEGYARVMASAPDELTAVAGVFPGPDGAATLLVAPAWAGDAERGVEALAALAGLGTPLVTDVASTSAAELLRTFDAAVVDGRHYYLTTRWLPELPPDAIAALLAAGNRRPSPLSAVALHHLHGAAVRRSPDASAFPLRQPHFMVEILAAWEGGGDDGRLHRAWADEVARSLDAIALPGGYPNLLGPEDTDRVAAAYGPNLPRLRALKQALDPDRVFSSAIPIEGGSQ